MKKSGKIFIYLAVLLAILGIANPFLFIGVPFLIYIGVKKIKKSRSLEVKMKERAIYLYDNGRYEDSLNIINQLEQMGKYDKECIVLKARNEYSVGNYEDYIRLLDDIPISKVNMDLDLLLKKGNTLLHFHNYKDALDVYKRILKINPESIYVLCKCIECEFNLDNYDNVIKYSNRIKGDGSSCLEEYNKAMEFVKISRNNTSSNIKNL